MIKIYRLQGFINGRETRPSEFIKKIIDNMKIVEFDAAFDPWD